MKAFAAPTVLRRTLPLASLLLITLYLAVFGWWRGTAVGPQVQVPMFYDDHYVYPRAWTQAQEAPGIPDPAPISLYGSNRISQQFSSTGKRLAVLELWLAGPDGTPIELSLTADDGTIYGGTVSLGAENGRFYRFTLPATATAQNFTLTLAAPQASAERPVVARTIGGDRLGGSLRLNEYLQPGNLELYSYSTGWLNSLSEQLLPAVLRLRLQQYKPAFFKGAAFSILLILTALATAVFFFLSMATRPKTAESAKQPASSSQWVLGLWAAFLLWQVGSGRVLLPGFTATMPLQPQPTALAVAPPPDGQPRLVQSFSQTLWTAVRWPEPRFIHTDLVAGLPAIVVPANSALEYALTVPLDGRLQLGMAVEGGDLRFTIRLGPQPLHSQTVTPADSHQWLALDLSAWGGQAGPLILQTEPLTESATGYWLRPQLLTSASWLMTEAALAERPLLPSESRFGESIALVGYEIEPVEEQLLVTLYWQPLTTVDTYATVFVHLLDEAGTIIAQSDNPPVRGTYPLAAWQVGTIIADQHRLPLSVVNGPYHLAVGLYDPVTLTRWPVTDAQGELLPDGRILLRGPQ